ncbi:MAG: tetratricopeptide repeat protein [Spirochaetia bacterium]|nr:tetratricopeptide repeat protein [Spirochaetia bacterium]
MKNLFMLTGFLVIGTSLGFFTINREYLNPSKTAKAMITKGKIYLEQSSKEACEKAVEKFSSVVSNYSKTPEVKEAIYYLGEAYEKMGNTGLALKNYMKLKEYKISPEMSEKINFKIAKIKILQSYADEGVSGFMNLLRKSKDSAMRSEIYNELGKYYAKKRELHEAEKHFKIAIKENGSFREAQLNLADILVKSEKYKEAYIVYNNYLEFYSDIDNEDKELLKQFRINIFNTGKNLYIERKYDHALDFLSVINKHFSNTRENEESLYYSSDIHFKRKNFEKAGAGFEAVLKNEYHEKDAAAMLKQGEIYFQLKNFTKAASLFNRTQKLFPSTQEAQAAKEWEDEIRRMMLDEKRLSKTQTQSIGDFPANEKNTDKKTDKENRSQTKKQTQSDPVELEYTIIPADEYDTIEEPSLVTNPKKDLIGP